MRDRSQYSRRAGSFFYGHVTVAEFPEFAESIVNGERVERLVLTPD